MIRKIFQWLLRNQKKEIEYKTEEKVKILMFSDYVPRIPEIILYIRRQREIPRRQLELTLIDKEDEPAWRIKGILRNLMKDPQVMYLVTDRAESFAEMEEEAMEMYGLPFLVLDKTELEKMPGNLVLDLNLWENQLDRFSKIWV
ncbi:hypothetical protein DWZ08_09735 [Clostridiaceae bacterium AF29-16BH]|nr:hypothetical protein DWZ37_11250 [Clostridiaceae bacterium AF31-3BH]RHQ24265.1 hypothetical protein DWZ08_09735 [Clostridiaceae bacterium AF29-16BH]